MVKTDIQIRFSDADMLRHINNVVLQQYYDIGKADYFQRVLGLPPIWVDEAFIAANTNTDYYEEVHFDDSLYVVTKIVKLGTKSVTMTQDIVEYGTEKIKSSSSSVLVAFDLNRRVGIAIRDELRAKIIAYEGDYVMGKK